jgi:hypothetical protein
LKPACTKPKRSKLIRDQRHPTPRARPRRITFTLRVVNQTTGELNDDVYWFPSIGGGSRENPLIVEVVAIKTETTTTSGMEMLVSVYNVAEVENPVEGNNVEVVEKHPMD